MTVRAHRVSIAVAIALLATACSPASDEPSPSPSPSATAAEPTPSPSPTAEPHEIVSGADVAILAKLEAPTTGEMWHEPAEISNLGLFSYSSDPGVGDYRYFEIGTRDGKQIVAVVSPSFDWVMDGYAPHAVVEWDGSNAELILCPSSRMSDHCLEYSTDWEAPGKALNTSVHYDSLTYPTSVSPMAGWELQTAPLDQVGYVIPVKVWGDASGFPSIAVSAERLESVGRSGTATVLADLGQSQLVEYRQPGSVDGLTDSRFAIITPYGGVLPSQSSISGAYYGQGAVSWDDGVDTFTHPDGYTGVDHVYAVRSASRVCSGPDETLADAYVASDWVQAGTHVLGFPVFLPAEGGNQIASDVFETMRDGSWSGDYRGVNLDYPYTYQQFLDARSVFAWERADGEWVIGMDAFASDRVYECD